MKIRITQQIPVDAAHGLTPGKVLDVLRHSEKGGVFVKSDTGGEVRVLPREYEVVPEAPNAPPKT